MTCQPHTGTAQKKCFVIETEMCSVGNNKLAQFRALELIMVVDYSNRIESCGTAFHVVLFLDAPGKSPLK